MIISTLSKLSDFQEHVMSYGRQSVIYRGVSNSSFGLIPKIGRLVIKRNQIARSEKMLIERFKREALPLLSFEPKDEWDWLSVAQHHGLPTRLLDWSHSALTAAFFAVEKDDDIDGAVYAYRLDYFINPSAEPDPYSGSEMIRKFYPRHVSSRIKAQSGLFTLHRKPWFSSKSQRIHKLIIPSEMKYELRTMLLRYGVNYSTLFPDLDGLSKHLEWIINDRVKNVETDV